MNGYDIGMNDSTITLGIAPTPLHMNIIGPGTITTNRTSNGSGPVIGDGSGVSVLTATDVTFRHSTGYSANYFTYAAVKCYGCRFELFDSPSGDVDAFEQLAIGSIFESCRFVGGGNSSELKFNACVEHVALQNCVFTGQFAQAAAPYGINIDGIIAKNMRFALTSGPVYIVGSHIDGIYLPNDSSAGVSIVASRNDSNFNRIRFDAYVWPNGQINLNGTNNAVLTECYISDLVLTGCSGTKLYNCHINKPNGVLLVDTSVSAEDSTFDNVIGTINITSDNCNFDKCRFNTNNLAQIVSQNGNDSKFTNCAFSNATTLVGWRCDYMSCYFPNDAVINGSYVKFTDCTVIGSHAGGSQGVTVSGDNCIITGCRLGVPGNGASLETIKSTGLNTIANDNLVKAALVGTVTGNTIYV
jgi:hypothetical protein